MEKVSYLGFDNCYRLANAQVEVIVTTDVGPRVIFYGRPGGVNQFGEFPEAKEETAYGVWKPYGGHRLWAAPEGMPFSYAPDNDPIEARIEGKFSVRLIQSTDAAGLQKEMTVTLHSETSHVRVHHKLINRRIEPIEVSIWALTIFEGGEAFVPLAPYQSHDDALMPTQPLILWPFTELSDHRIKLGNGWVHLTSDPALLHPQKLGLANLEGWAARHKGGELFVKRYNYEPGVPYPDFGSNTEVYVAGSFMEIETLSPLKRLQVGDSIEHLEHWELLATSRESLGQQLNELRSHKDLKV